MQKRNINLDVIRTVAVLSVLSVHFFMFSGFYNEILNGTTMHIATILRTNFMVCVPLFLILSGYLMNQKKLSLQYFKGISRVLITYVLACIPIIAFRIYYCSEVFTIQTMIQSILSFEKYSWYIEMYIGLYLLIPFLNLTYNNLSDKKEKTTLVFIFLLLTVIPSITSSVGLDILPNSWVSIYPITYYFIGAYIKDFASDIKIPAFALLGIYVLMLIAFGSFIFIQFQNLNFKEAVWTDWGGFVNTCTASTLFLFLLKCDFNHLPKFLAKIIETISLVSLPLYLVSWIFDTIVYDKFRAYIPLFADRLKYIPIPVFLSFLGSFIIACIINSIYNLIKKIGARS